MNHWCWQKNLWQFECRLEPNLFNLRVSCEQPSFVDAANMEANTSRFNFIMKVANSIILNGYKTTTAS